MRKLIGVLTIAGGAMLLAPAPASAEVIYPWCAQYSGGLEGSGATNCGFVTWRQCWDTVAGGRIGDCYENPMYQSVARPGVPYKKRYRYAHPG